MKRDDKLPNTKDAHPQDFAGIAISEWEKVAAPFHGKPLFGSVQSAAATLKRFTGQDFGTDAQKWGGWLRSNRQVYYR
ncbi:MAG: hypothetical protein JNM56_14265 [Planctomycetia bacterium]|nr:hypothetical protein [Planctomycetia bacterium]